MRVAVLLSLLLVGCASGQWMKEGSAAGQLEADLAACEYEAVQSTAWCETGFKPRRRSAYPACAVPEAQSACMRAKGYRYVTDTE